jgi:hypothetical protein
MPDSIVGVARSLTLGVALGCVAATASAAQSAAEGPVVSARHVNATLGLKIWNPAGRVRFVAWDRDSLVVRGHAGRGFFAAGDSGGVKMGTGGQTSNENDDKSDLVIYVPRRSMLTVKTVGADIDGANVSGSFNTVSGAIHLSGAASSVEAESMTGSLDLDVTVPWMRARTGDGHLLLRGRPQDVDVATIGGTLDIATTTPLRGQFSSVSGDIHYVGGPLRGAIFEFSNHSGGVDLLLPQNVSGVFTLSSVEGSIENNLSGVRPAAAPPRALRLTLGAGGASVTVRTFKGTIRLRSD